ncbi:hypothetical protein TWF106_009132 [Orbilia oligospora]|uniref:Uncharacterized protein n=1 Tax=Orbilia oligospora TaxID=2813651 RepID=A0A6G1MCF5_ORBOL|nr:hypothetical protein TWF788_009042 [Orbilia oligospora]KAF3216397.1 hypothetical protein TWF679_003017 [Orbilia oligospora]KAF3224167.1 hypothetical protein TWF191_006281 [Orbilia oligospora]KAF3227618.1 hypothetical protein TWF106_009132 [Orbilia oligospora]KAF3251114.1 hypothetical protein TWF192_005087 [Orbilia oligospora]
MLSYPFSPVKRRRPFHAWPRQNIVVVELNLCCSFPRTSSIPKTYLSCRSKVAMFNLRNGALNISLQLFARSWQLAPYEMENFDPVGNTLERRRFSARPN